MLFRSRVVRWWDFAATKKRASGRQPDFTASVKATYDPETDLFYIVDTTLTREDASGVETLVHSVVSNDGETVEQHIEQEPGSSGVQVIRYWEKELRPYNVSVTAHSATGSKRGRWLGLRSAIEQGRVRAVRSPTLPAFLDQLAALTHDEARDEKEQRKDDAMDAASGAFRILIGLTVDKRAGYVGSIHL